MSLQRVLGVIDVRDGQAVHAVAGRRDHYRPLAETPASSPRPAALAAHYLRLGVGGLYVADLNAICGGELQLAVLRELESMAVPVWIDAGIRSRADWQEKAERLPGDGWRWILATETFAEGGEPDHLFDRQCSPPLRARLDAGQVTIGIDLVRGRLRLPHNRSSSESVLERVACWSRRGVDSFLPLEITAVGSESGVATLELCRRIRRDFPDVELLSGGGIRDAGDLQRLLDAGCDRVLAATALQNGLIGPLPTQPVKFKS